jgi:hypothetical protein
MKIKKTRSSSNSKNQFLVKLSLKIMSPSRKMLNQKILNLRDNKRMARRIKRLRCRRMMTKWRVKRRSQIMWKREPQPKESI